MVDAFPTVTKTFILNQITGLLDRGQDVRIFARPIESTETSHDIIEEYKLLDRVVYSQKPGTYTEGLRTLAGALGRFASSRPISARTLLGQFSLDKELPYHLSNLAAVLGEDDFDVYHAHFGHIGTDYLGVTDCRTEPFIVSFYGVDASQRLREDPDRYDNLFSRADAITVLSEDMRADLVDAGCPASKTHIQPLCVDVDKFPYRERDRSDDEPVRILTVARFVEKKGLEYALRAVATLDDNYDITYRIAGDGNRRDRIERLIEDLGLRDTVELLGWQTQSAIVEEMHDAHAFVLPSVTAENGNKEGTPTVLLEAQATGLPVVSTYHAGIPEIVGDGTTGHLVPERDVDALADAIEMIITDEDRSREMGQRGRDRIESTHAIEVVSRDLVDLYRSLQ
jgi:colanic acid/amylovoran biosynthesis glycosyltransferase